MEGKMKKAELISLLAGIAEGDLVEGEDIYDHPCTVAIRALNNCFDDIKLLQQIANKQIHGKSKKCQTLLGLNYSLKH
jgi:hypothetical protein